MRLAITRRLSTGQRIFIFLAILLLPHAIMAGTLNIGSTSDTPAREIKALLPLAIYLGKALHPEGITQGQVVVGRSLSESAMFLRNAKIDLYIDSPFPSLAVSRLSGSKLLVRRWKKGVGEYHSVIFTRKDSGIDRLEHLYQKVLGFEAPYSSSAFFLPKVVLMQKGFKLMHIDDPSSAVAHGKVGYTFTGDDENTMLWVLREKVGAGVLDDQIYANLAGENLDQLHIIHRTFSIPRHIVSHRANLPLRLATRIKDILIRMNQSAEGNKTLREFEKTTKFDEIPAPLMAPLRQSWKLIEADLAK
jgi:phosphonate transport system substrate-binding protein